MSPISPSAIIAAAKKAHPAFKYAVVVAGLAAIVASILKFGLSPITVTFGIVLLLSIMVVFVVFAGVAKLPQSGISVPAKILVWMFTLMLVATVALLFTSVFFNWPLTLRDKVMDYQGFANYSLKVYPKPLKALSEVEELIKTAKAGSQITFSGVHFAIITNDLDDELYAALQRGVSLRFAVMKNSPELIKEFVANYSHIDSTVQREIIDSFANLGALKMKHAASATSGNEGKLEIAEYDFIPEYRAYWFDYGTEGGVGILVPYSRGVRSSDTPAVEVMSGTPLGDHFRKSLNWHWSKSKAWAAPA